MPLLLVFILVPVFEIYLLIKVGGLIGALPTVLLIIATAMLGTALLRQQGLSTMRRYQKSIEQGRMPAAELIEGLALLVGGILLLTPGFFTDAIGLLCLLPPTRKVIIKWLMSKVNFTMMGAGAAQGRWQRAGKDGDKRTFEGEFEREDESSDRQDRDQQGGRFPPDRF